MAGIRNFLALMERVPHFHLWLVPKKKGPLKDLVPRPAVPATHRAAVAMSKTILIRFKRS